MPLGLDRAAAVEADQAARVAYRAFASALHRDARAPVSLDADRGFLERHLHRRQGDARLALRAVREAVLERKPRRTGRHDILTTTGRPGLSGPPSAAGGRWPPDGSRLLRPRAVVFQAVASARRSRARDRPLRTTTAAGRLFAVLAEFERELIREPTWPGSGPRERWMSSRTTPSHARLSSTRFGVAPHPNRALPAPRRAGACSAFGRLRNS